VGVPILGEHDCVCTHNIALRTWLKSTSSAVTLIVQEFVWIDKLLLWLVTSCKCIITILLVFLSGITT
jgi:hypothetical protein